MGRACVTLLEGSPPLLFQLCIERRKKTPMKILPAAFTLWFALIAPLGHGQDSIDNSALQFDGLLRDWDKLAHQAQQEKNAGYAESRAITQEVHELLDRIVADGLAIYGQDPQNYPTVNSTLETLARFFVSGDAHGDGGDQYEKSLPIIQVMLESGAASQVQDLWLWGGVSAYCTGNFDLAEKYLRQASLVAPPGDPQQALRQRAARYLESIPDLRQAWQKEKQIRAAEAQANNLPRVKFETTRGNILIELLENEAPQAVANFLTLVKQGYYDGIVFHRVLPQFMAQGGDPTGTGSGGPGYHIRCECHGDKIRKHFRGSLSMAHAGRDTGGSQFFLTYVPTSYLDGRHTVFGRVIEGIEVAVSLKRRDPTPGAPTANAPPDKILKAEVVRDRGHAYEFDKLPAG